MEKRLKNDSLYKFNELIIKSTIQAIHVYVLVNIENF